MNKKQQTIETYQQRAESFAMKFDQLGARREDIEEVFSLVAEPDPLVVEIGCANGRDAEIILQHTKRYLGVDVSRGLIAIAKERLPQASFVVEDIEVFEFPKQVQIIFAFASLIHVDREALQEVFARAYEAATEGCLFRLSLKKKDVYQEHTQEDAFGVRTYYYYNAEVIRSICGSWNVVDEWETGYQQQEWLEMILKK